ncbi:hypothetical protein [Nocardioides dongkuii]|uniref:hypothetical protein n=1 Tax=Nocardioides dongkuii TaxID=2760089 RepID=UPI0015F82647|nr:hypothetical protein [Nocardioides dongkuii]
MTATRRARLERAVVLAAGVLVVVWAAAWIRVGIDTGDGGYVVALQLRIAQGDLPLVDELNPQSLGALHGAPFVWLWHQLFGLGGLVLAARAAFLVATVAVGVLAYRALRTVAGPPAAFAAVTVACLAIPYGIPVLSYNTVPILGSVLSAGALAATVETGSRRWAVVCGAALGLGTLANPQWLPAGLVLGVVSLVWLSARLWLPLLAAAAAPLLVLGLWVLAVPGVGRLRNAVSYMQDTRAAITPGSERLENNLHALASPLLTPTYLVLLALAALVTAGVLLRPRSWIPGAALAVLPVAALVPVLRVAWRPLPAEATTALTLPGDIGATSLQASAAAVGVLLVPCLAWLARHGRRSLFAVGSFGLGVGLVVTPLLAASTASGPSRGIAGAGLAVALLVLVLTAIEAAEPARWPVGAAAAVATVAAMAGIASATTFPTVPVGRADTSVSSGAWAGMVGAPGYVDSIRTVRAALAEHADPGDRVLGVAAPAFPLMADVRVGSPMLWLTFWGDGNRRGVRWLEDPANTPDVVLVVGHDARALSRGRALRTDVLAEHLRSDYTVVDTTSDPPLTVLRRNPTD